VSLVIFKAGVVLATILVSLSAQAATFTVNDNGTAPDASIDGTCATAGAACTLRAAIEEANATSALDVIVFNSSMTIVESGLPEITQPVRIDGEANTVVIEGTPVSLGGTSDGSRIARLTIRNSPAGGLFAGSTNAVVIGNTISANANFGIRVTASGAEIGGDGDGDGNVINGTSGGSGIEVLAGPATITANRIGTDATGTVANANAHGIYVTANGVEIRGNLISGNGGNGMRVDMVTGLVVETNLIGTDASGTAVLGNGGSGISLMGPSGGVVRGNVVSGNRSGMILQVTTGNTIEGNFVGTDLTGTLDLGNTLQGIRLLNGSQNALLGNVVAFNESGIEISELGAATDQNRLSANRVFDNTQIGLDLQSLAAGGGITSNDPGDADDGANQFQNFPVINCMSSDDSSTTFAGTLNSAPSTTYRIEVFTNPGCQSSSGREYVGFTDVTTDASGNASILVTLPVVLPPGTVVTSTATDPLGNTSEYSSCGFVGTNALNVSDEYFAWEPDGSAMVYVMRQAVPQPATVDYAMTDGTATAADYTAVTGTLTFAACETMKSFVVPVTDDPIDEPSETAVITFSNPTGGATLNRTTASFLIEDDDGTPVLTLTPPAASMPENGSTTLTFTLDRPSSRDVVVSLAFSGTATPADYSGAVASVLIPALQTSVTLTLTAIDDATHEGDKTIVVDVTSVTNAIEATPQSSTVTIVDDEPVPTLTINSVSQVEGNSGTSLFAFTVTLSNTTTATVTANFATADVTATAGSDYQSAGGVVTFAPGTTTQTLNVTVNGDTAFEPNETFEVRLTGAVNTSNATATGTGTILNDEGSADVSIVKTGPPTVVGGALFEYVLTVRNAGPDAATNVTVTDALVAGLTLQGATPSQGSCSGTTTVICTLGTLAAGQSATVSLLVYPSMRTGTLTNTATVTSALHDPTPANGSSTATAQLAAAEVPTLSEWMLLALAAALALAGVMRRG
jgi:uncharacterized repeat protein (TIGR01451 family)